MTLAEIRASVRGKLDDAAYDPDVVDEAANWFQDEVFAGVRTRLMEASDTIVASAGDTNADFPSDIQTWISLTQTTPQLLRLKPYFVQYEEFVQTFPDYAARLPSPIYAWTTFANQIRFGAPLLQDVVIPIDYIRRPVPMVSDNDDCEIPDAYRKMVTIGTLAEVMERNEDYAEAQQERNKLAPLMTTFIRNEGRGQDHTGPIVMRTNRRGGSAVNVVRRRGGDDY